MQERKLSRRGYVIAWVIIAIGALTAGLAFVPPSGVFCLSDMAVIPEAVRGIPRSCQELRAKYGAKCDVRNPICAKQYYGSYTPFGF